MKLSIPQLILLPILAYSGYFIAGEEPLSTWLEGKSETTNTVSSEGSKADKSSAKKKRANTASASTKGESKKSKRSSREKTKVAKAVNTSSTPFTRYSDFILTPAFLSDSVKGNIPHSSYKGPHLSKQDLAKGIAAKRTSKQLSTPDAAGTITLRYYDATPRGNVVSWDFWAPTATNYRVFINLKKPADSFDGTIKYNGKKLDVSDGKSSAVVEVKKPNKHQFLIGAASGSDTKNIQAIYLVPEDNLSSYATKQNPTPPSPDLSRLPKEMVKKMEDIASAGYDIHSTVAKQMKSGKNGYLIFTTEAKRASLTNLNAFIHHKEYRGFNVTVVTEQDYGGGTGAKAAFNIRRWLQNNFQAKNALYALMLGNPNPASGDIPYKNCGAAAEASDDDDAFGKSKEQLEGGFPTDYFYADLDCNWDLNKNGFYGDDADFEDGGINGQPEVYVGRIPFYGVNAAKGNAKDVDRILERIIRYENKVAGMTSRHDLFYTGYDENRVVNLYDGFFKHNGAKLTLHSKDHTAPFLANIKRPKLKDTIATLNSEKFGFVFYQAEDPEDVFLTSSDIAKLSPKSPSVYSIKGISAAEPSNPDNIAFALLRNSAIAVYAPTKGTEGYEDFDEYQHAAYYSRLHFGMSTGEALWTTLADQTRDRGIDEGHFLANLLGDPSVVPMPQTSGPTLSVSPGFDVRIDASEDRKMDYEIRNNGATADNYSIKSVAQLSLSETQFTLESGEARVVTVELKDSTPLKKGINKFTFHINSSVHKKQRHFIIIK